MFKQGKSIADISIERGFSLSTIEGHLAAFVKTGEVDILDLTDNATLDKLLPLFEAEPQLTYSAIKEKAGSDVSYGAIRAVANYVDRIKNSPS
jgi:hypothetical protein